MKHTVMCTYALSSALRTAAIWVAMSRQPWPSSIMRWMPRNWPSARLSRFSRSARVLASDSSDMAQSPGS